MRKLGQSTGERRFRGIDTTGFTLIELLVVLTIIGVLAAAGTVGMSRSRAQGHVATMRADLRSIAVAQEVYFEDQSAI
ncbi:MAG: type IV pilin protein, partial [Gemmatimonadota bacterium]